MGQDPAGRAAREAALRLRRELASVFDALGAVHLQIGKCYDFANQLDDGAAQTLRAIRATLDPAGLVNRGSLGI